METDYKIKGIAQKSKINIPLPELKTFAKVTEEEVDKILANNKSKSKSNVIKQIRQTKLQTERDISIRQLISKSETELKKTYVEPIQSERNIKRKEIQSLVNQGKLTEALAVNNNKLSDSMSGLIKKEKEYNVELVDTEKLLKNVYSTAQSLENRIGNFSTGRKPNKNSVLMAFAEIQSLKKNGVLDEFKKGKFNNEFQFYNSKNFYDEFENYILSQLTNEEVITSILSKINNSDITIEVSSEEEAIKLEKLKKTIEETGESYEEAAEKPE